MVALYIITGICWIIATVAAYYAASRYHANCCQYPPGPPTYPLIGNIFELSPRALWFKLTQIQLKYGLGDLVFFQGLGTHILVLNSYSTIVAALETQANVFSDRPVFTVVGKLMGLDQSMPLLPYSHEWRAQRKMAHVALSPAAVKNYHRIQEDFAVLLCKNFLDHPENFFNDVRLTSSKIILAITYGINVEDGQNEFITHAEQTMKMIGEATVPGAFFCDFFPLLKHAPSWVPFQKRAKAGHQMISHLVEKPFRFVNDQLAKGTAKASLMHDLILNSSDTPNFKHHLMWMTGSLYGAGGETNYATVLTFMMAMALNPSVQRKAQHEIDCIVGNDRLPIIKDHESLPYVSAVIKETMRWHPALPLGIARISSMDANLNGYYIPKGTIVIPNIWALAFQPHPKFDVHEFIPERYLDGAFPLIDPSKWVFGFGRRICPGRHLAENSIFGIISMILSMFDILPPLDGIITRDFGPNLVSYPEPFKCRILPRSQEKVAILEEWVHECSISSGKS